MLTGPLLAQPTVIATHSILGDWVKNITGDTVRVLTLIPADTDNHTFEANPGDTVELSKAQIIFENGLEMEFWLNKIFQASNSKAQRIALSKNITPIQIHCCHCHHGNCDPHFWLSIPNAINAIEIITDALTQTFPQFKEIYTKNKERYTKELSKADTFVRTTINTIPQEKRNLITNHDSLRYFAKEYNLRILGTALDSSSTDTMDPSAMHFAQLLKIIKSHKISMLFAENIGNNAVLKELARESQLPEPAVLYTGALGKHGSHAETYINMMRYNAQTIANNLK